jgi:DNA-binding PadR family transcriptional regulator
VPLKTNEGVPMTSTAFHILLALSKQEQHGYSIIKAVLEQSDQKIRLGAGVLYSNLKRFTDLGWIEELEERPAPDADDERRRYYRLTKIGWRAAQTEAKRLENLVQKAAPLLRRLV